MLELLILVLAGASAVDIETHAVSVHEAGIVVFGSEAVSALGALPHEDRSRPEPEIRVTAPILWFHGAPFTGSFTVDAGEGEITAAYPDPEAGFPGRLLEAMPEFLRNPSRVTWTGISAGEQYSEQEIPYGYPCRDGLPFGWAVPLWRNVPSLGLVSHPGGWYEDFLYYESDAGVHFSELAESMGLDSFDVLEMYEGRALLIVPGAMQPSMRTVWVGGGVAPLTGDDPFQDMEMLLSVLSGYADYELEQEEIRALWSSWQADIAFTPLDQGGWLLFPLPGEWEAGISTLELRTDQDADVEYHRFLLGLVRVGNQECRTGGLVPGLR